MQPLRLPDSVGVNGGKERSIRKFRLLSRVHDRIIRIGERDVVDGGWHRDFKVKRCLDLDMGRISWVGSENG